jgi:peptidoglycan/xylan/chitin deacetylase (PgdA/CDA1 family)
MATVCLTFDFDAVSSWISDFRQTTPGPLSRGEFGARVGVPRILELLAKHDVMATFFVPGQTARTYPERVEEIAAAGHEVGAHGDLHRSPGKFSREEEERDLAQAEAALESVIGVRPIGYRSPAWDVSPHTYDLLVERGYSYSSNLMSDDFTPFCPRTGDLVGEDASFTAGKLVPLLEFPVAWELDDFVYFNFMGKTLPGLRNPEDVEAIWRGEFDFFVRKVPDGVFTLTMHPQVIGRGPRIEMLDRLIAHMKSAPDIAFLNMGMAAESFAHLPQEIEGQAGNCD